MKLAAAPAKQLEKAIAATKAFQALNIGYCRIYRNYNSKIGKVRVKFYACDYVQGGKLKKVEALGFGPHSTRFNRITSFVAYF